MGTTRSVKRPFWRDPGMLPLMFVLGAGVIATWIILSVTPADPAGASKMQTAVHIYLVDTEGWYQITPNEAAVASPFIFSTTAMNSLPVHIGGWTGTPRVFGDYEGEVDKWFDNPDVGLSTAYLDANNHTLWFSVFGSIGSKSYSLFEHTPVTSYPANGWTLLDSGVVVVPINGVADGLHVRRAYLELNATKEKRVVYYWYLWPDTARDPEKGVLTMRVHVPVVSNVAEADRTAQGFIQQVFSQVLAWHRF